MRNHTKARIAASVFAAITLTGCAAQDTTATPAPAATAPSTPTSTPTVEPTDATTVAPLVHSTPANSTEAIAAFGKNVGADVDTFVTLWTGAALANADYYSGKVTRTGAAAALSVESGYAHSIDIAGLVLTAPDKPFANEGVYATLVDVSTPHYGVKVAPQGTTPGVIGIEWTATVRVYFMLSGQKVQGDATVSFAIDAIETAHSGDHAWPFAATNTATKVTDYSQPVPAQSVAAATTVAGE